MEKLYILLKKRDISQGFKDSIILSLAEGYRQKRNYDIGIQILQDLLSKNKPDYVKAKAYNRIAALYNEWLKFGASRYDSTLYYSFKCMKIAEKNNFIDLLASSQNEIGFVYMKLKKTAKAREYYYKAYKNFNLLKEYLYSANVAINISNVYLYNKNYTEAISVIDSSLNKISQEKYKNMAMRLYLQKANIYEKISRYDSAFKYLAKVRIMQVKFFHSRMDEKIYEMTAKYDLKLKEAKLKEIEQNNIRKQNENKFLILLISSMLVLFIVLVYVVYLKRKSLIREKELEKKEKDILKENIEYKNKELTNIIAHTVATNDILKKIKKLLQEKNYTEILKIINVNINTESNWNNFLIKFNENYPDFFYRLEKVHPELTKSETKLSALLLMKLSSKEIAYILNIEVGSVSKSRQRLRKKLNINSDVSFYDYLSTI